jgi:hypothetical protein
LLRAQFSNPGQSLLCLFQKSLSYRALPHSKKQAAALP